MRIQIARAAAVVAVFAAAAAAAACSNPPTAPAPAGPKVAAAARSVTLSGTIVVAQTDTGGAIMLLTAGGDSVLLLGPLAQDASQVAGSAPLWVTGVLNAPNMLYVDSYALQADDPNGCNQLITYQVRRDMQPCQDRFVQRRQR